MMLEKNTDQPKPHRCKSEQRHNCWLSFAHLQGDLFVLLFVSLLFRLQTVCTALH